LRQRAESLQCDNQNELILKSLEREKREHYFLVVFNRDKLHAVLMSISARGRGGRDELGTDIGQPDSPREILEKVSPRTSLVRY
jgi:hypothetical protein